MSTTSFFCCALMFSLSLALGNCSPPPPPVINDFTVVPRNQCATVPVAVRWGADADHGRLTISPATGETPPDPLPSLAGGGFRFATAATDTTYTLTVQRGGQTAVQSRTVQIVRDPFVMSVELPYNCAERLWEHPGLSDQEYGEVLTVQHFYNPGDQGLLIEFGGQLIPLRPRTTQALQLPVRLTGGRWRARLEGGVFGPECGGAGTTNPNQPWQPPPVRVTVTSSCPRR